MGMRQHAAVINGRGPIPRKRYPLRAYIEERMIRGDLKGCVQTHASASGPDVFVTLKLYG